MPLVLLASAISLLCFALADGVSYMRSGWNCLWFFFLVERARCAGGWWRRVRCNTAKKNRRIELWYRRHNPVAFDLTRLNSTRCVCVEKKDILKRVAACRVVCILGSRKSSENPFSTGLKTKNETCTRGMLMLRRFCFPAVCNWPRRRRTRIGVPRGVRGLSTGAWSSTSSWGPERGRPSSPTLPCRSVT